MAVWAPVAFGAGAITYFSLAAEPAAWVGWAGLLAGGAVALTAFIFMAAHPVRWTLLLLTAFALFGFARAEIHTRGQSTVFVPESGQARLVTGWIEQVQNRNGRDRLVVRVGTLEGLDPAPRRLRFYAQRGELAPGDGITARVVLRPPRRPAVPGGYDPAFAAWFSGLGGTGFAIEPLEAADIAGQGAQRRIVRWRWQMAEHIRSRAAPETAGIAAALLTGDRSGIPPAQAESLRAAGLGHILAISGLHMSLFAGGLFFAARAVGAAIPSFARRHDSRIPAAVIALVGAGLYFILSGGSVSTQRAFVMVACVLVGVLLKRRAISMQSIALAAGIILVLEPQSILSPGFQMSFAAAAALVAAFDLWRRRSSAQGPRSPIRAFAGFWGTLSFSSLVAGSATAVFAAFHFNRIAVFGFAANLLAMPVFSLVVMPAGALALVLAPFGLDGPALAVMSWGLVWVVRIADWVSSWPGALAPMASAPGLVLALYAGGFSLLVAARGAYRRVGLVIMLIAYAGWLSSTPPDAFVSEEGIVLARFDNGADNGWASTDRRRSRFATRVFLEQAGEQARPGRDGISCDAQGCLGEAAGVEIAVAESAESLAADCHHARLVVLEDHASPIDRAACDARLIDRDNLEADGAIALWLAAGDITRLETVADRRGDRIWTREPARSSAHPPRDATASDSAG